MKELIEKLKKKDDNALREVMALYKSQIFNYLHLMTSSREMAEELTQDTFVKVYFKAGSLKTENLKAWIYTIATNLARSEFRKKKLKSILSLAETGENIIPTESKPENPILYDQVLKSLPDKYRIPLVMKEAENFTYEEIAEITGKPVGTVKSLVFRAKEQIQKDFSIQMKGGINERYRENF